MNKKPEDNIPEQEEGAQTNTEASKKFKDVEGAQDNEVVAIGAYYRFCKTVMEKFGKWISRRQVIVYCNWLSVFSLKSCWYNGLSVFFHLSQKVKYKP